MVPLRPFILVSLLASLVIPRSHELLAQPGGERNNPSPASDDRIIKYFDFDERQRGNLETLPMLWTRHRSQGFPAYAEGWFDLEVGRQSSPSFYLELDGKSCAYHYSGLDIPIEPESDYRIAAAIKPDRLLHARAYMSAFLLDANGVPIEGTERRSRFVGGNASSTDWQEVSVRLRGHVDAAYSIGLAVWVVQRPFWWSGKRQVKLIDHRDVNGGAWFDDISVYRLPSIGLTSTAAASGNLYKSHETPTLLVSAGDISRRGLQAKLVVRDAAGSSVHEEQVDVNTSHQEAWQRIELRDLPAGAYHARLSVAIEEGVAPERHLSFVKMSPPVRDRLKSKSRFGIVVDPEPAKDWPAHTELLAAAGVMNVKVALQDEQLKNVDQDMAGLDEFIRRQNDRQVLLTGTFVEPAAENARAASGSTQSLIDLFSRPADVWLPYVAQAVTRYENQFRFWQIGVDGRSDVIEDSRLGLALQNLRSEMSKLTTNPVLVVPWSVYHQPGKPILPANILSLSIPSEIQPAQIPTYIDESCEELEYEAVWALLETLPAQRYQRLPRLADFSKRLIYAHQSSAKTVFIHQPWRSRAGVNAVSTEPNELLLIFRTIVSLLDDATYLGEVQIGENVTCHAFDRHGEAILAMWDDFAPMEGKAHDLYLSGAEEVADLWGNTRKIHGTGALQQVQLSPLPVFVYSAESWLVQFRQGLRFDPILLPSEETFHEQEILVPNPRQDPITGSIKLKSPPGWRIRPNQFAFAIPAGGSISQKVRIQASPREPAGRKQIEARVTLDALQLYEFEVHLPLELDLSDMSVWVDIVLEGDLLIVRHGITNRSQEVVSFNSFIDAVDRKRQTMDIVGLQPGQTIVKTHRFSKAHQLSGSQIRVALRQVKGPRSHNLTVMVP